MMSSSYERKYNYSRHIFIGMHIFILYYTYAYYILYTCAELMINLMIYMYKLSKLYMKTNTFINN